eukprot:jgi/Mesvir1/5413/Mv15477-RA.1
MAWHGLVLLSLLVVMFWHRVQVYGVPLACLRSVDSHAMCMCVGSCWCGARKLLHSFLRCWVAVVPCLAYCTGNVVQQWFGRADTCSRGCPHPPTYVCSLFGFLVDIVTDAAYLPCSPPPLGPATTTLLLPTLRSPLPTGRPRPPAPCPPWQLQRSAQVAKAQLQRHASINAAQGHGLQRQPTYETAALTGGGVDAGKGGGARGDVTDGRGRGSARASASTSAHSFIELVADVARGTATGQERAQAPNMHRLRVSDDGVLPGTLGLGGGMHELQAAGMSDHRYIWGQLGNVLLRFFAAPTTLAVMYVVSYAINQRVQRAFDDSVVGSAVSLAVYPACYVVGMFAMVVYLVLSKWLVMGRYREGLYPFWSTRFNLWQLQVVFMKIVDMYVLADLRSSYLLTLVYRLMGATIGADVLLDAHPRVEMDLLTMEDGAVLGYRAFQYGHVIDNMCLQFGRTRVAARAIVGARSMVLIGSTLEADAMLLGYSLALKGELFAPNTVWEGLPAVRVSRGSG